MRYGLEKATELGSVVEQRGRRSSIIDFAHAGPRA
jgi:hypothetical protein